MSDISRMKCGWKRRYVTNRVALKRAEKRSHDGSPLYTYRCPHCKFFHLTSSPQRPDRR